MEVFMRLGLKEVSYVIKTLGISDDVPYLHGNVVVDGKLYIYEKKGNELTITGEDGKSVKVAVNCFAQQKFNERGDFYEIYKHKVGFDYGLDNGEHLTFYKELGLNPGYVGFEDVNRHDLLTNTRTKYIDKTGEEVANFSTEVNGVHLANSENSYVFELNGGDKPIAIIHEDGEMTFSYSDTEESKKAAEVRIKILDGIANHAIDPNAIELVERKFRADVFDYKAQHKLSK